jgi:hypothetical protein
VQAILFDHAQLGLTDRNALIGSNALDLMGIKLRPTLMGDQAPALPSLATRGRKK